MDNTSEFFYKYWIEGTINDASITKIYQDNKLIYDSSKELNSHIETHIETHIEIIIDDNLSNEDLLANKLKELTILK